MRKYTVRSSTHSCSRVIPVLQLAGLRVVGGIGLQLAAFRVVGLLPLANNAVHSPTSIDISLFVCVTTGQVETEDSCNEYESCDDCIAKGRGCVWCPDPPVSVQHTLSIIP